ncbi:MAG: hypothetical protein U0350_39265 [Caldilineaceae bacterium]
MLGKSSRKTLFAIGILTTFILFSAQLLLNIPVTGEGASDPLAGGSYPALGVHALQQSPHTLQHPLLTPTVTPTITPTPTVTPTLFCPQATPELLAVEPITSPTHALSETVTVFIGNGEAVTVTAESGVFASLGLMNLHKVVVDLLPNRMHHLTVFAKVRTVSGPGGCTYGGYTLKTTQDRLGQPLVIVQQRQLYFPFAAR